MHLHAFFLWQCCIAGQPHNEIPICLCIQDASQVFQQVWAP